MPANASIVEESLDDLELITEEPKKHKKNWKKKFIYFTLFILLLYPLSLIVINTSWAKSKLTDKLAAKTGLEWQVGSIIWVPFGDVYVNDLNTVPTSVGTADAGGISLESISISPIWSSLLSGDLVWNEIRLDGVNLDVERTWLEEMMKKSSIASLPELKQSPKQAPPVKVKPENPDKKAPPIAQRPKPISPRKPKQEKKELAKKPETPEQTLIISGLNIKVRDKEKTWFQCDGISMNIPFSGKSRNGSISIVDESGKTENLPVIWDEKTVVIEKTGIELFGMKIDLKTRVNTISSSKMFAYQIIIHEQPYHYEIHRPNLNVVLNADHLQGQFIMSGSLLSPQTWNGFGGIQLSKFSIQETQKTMKKLEFDEVYARGRMLQGSLLIDDAAARSEELTFMANGVIRKDTYAYGVIRCVANEEQRIKLDRIYEGSHAISLDIGHHSLFDNLETPDRRYFDLHFDGKLANLEYKHKRGNKWASFNQCLKNLKKFKNNELKEDGIFNLKMDPSEKKKSTSDTSN